MKKSDSAFVHEEEGNMQQWTSILQCRSTVFPLNYLGLLLSNKKLTISYYLPLLNKIGRRLPGWGAKKLSPAGRLVFY
jgi:hypothetical protein